MTNVINAPTPGLIRVCGQRKLGSVYGMTHTGDGPNAFPLDHFLIDPVIPVLDPGSLGVSAQGISLHPAHDDRATLDLWDWIGAGSGPNSQGYWNVWDYLREGQEHGFSALIPRTTLADPRWKQVTTAARRILIHPHAALENAFDYTDHRLGPCLTKREACANNGGYLCTALTLEATEGGQALKTGREVRRFLPPWLEQAQASTTYEAWTSPRLVKPEWQTALFAWLPIHELHVIHDAEAGTHEKALELLQNSGTKLPYKLTSE